MEKTMEKIVALAKARGFVYPGSEIYGGLANTWDYGNLGVELKNNVKKAWWQKFVLESPYSVGVDCAILMNPQTWVASGHLGGFSDPLMDCKECHERFRADKLIEDYAVLCKSRKQQVGMLSGGNIQKVILARELDADPEILIAAQPTRGVDIGAIEYIRKQLVALRDSGKAILLVSAELEEILSLSDRIIVMYEGEIVGTFRPEETTEEELGLYMTGSRRMELDGGAL